MRIRRNKSDDTGSGAAPTSVADAQPGAAMPAGADTIAATPTGAEFDMNTVGIAPEPAAAPAQHSRKGDAPPAPTDINSVGVAILPGVPLPSWVAPVPAPVAQHPVDPLYQQQTVAAPTPEPPVQAWPASAPVVSPSAPPDPAPVAAAPTTPPVAVVAPAAPTPLPPPDPAQWSEHPLGPVVWGPVAPSVPPQAQRPAPETAPSPAPAVPSAPPPMAPPSTAPVFAAPQPQPQPQDSRATVSDEPEWPTVAPVAAAATTATAWFQDTPAATPTRSPDSAQTEQYGWLLQPDSGAPTTSSTPPSAPAPVAPPQPTFAAQAPVAPVAPPTRSPEPESTAPAQPTPAPPAPAPPTPAAPVSYLTAPPPAGPAFDYVAPTPAVATTDSAPPVDGTQTGEAPADGARSGAMKWILIVGGVVVALALLAFAAFVTPGFLASAPATDTAPTVATPATAAGLPKSPKAVAAPTAVFKKMAAATGAAGASQYATYANEGTSATVWVAPVFGGSPQSLAQAYAAAGGLPLDAPTTVAAGPRGGEMQCASASAKQTLCFWTADGVRGAADITGASRSGAGELAAKLRIALEPAPAP